MYIHIYLHIYIYIHKYICLAPSLPVPSPSPPSSHPLPPSTSLLQMVTIKGACKPARIESSPPFPRTPGRHSLSECRELLVECRAFSLWNIGLYRDTHCNTRQHTATHCNTRQHTATHGNTPQHTATHCNTLQDTATHYRALYRSSDDPFYCAPGRESKALLVGYSPFSRSALPSLAPHVDILFWQNVRSTGQKRGKKNSGLFLCNIGLYRDQPSLHSHPR